MSLIIRRGFVDVSAGQVHYREAGRRYGGRPLVMLHASPGSAKGLEPLIAQLAQHRHVVGLDTLGNGDSSGPMYAADGARPPLTYFSDAHLEAIDALGIGDFDLYGTHTGASLACEIALSAPARVRRMILDGVALYAPSERSEMLARYAPGVAIDLNGTHLQWVFQFVRDVYLFWPWYRPDAEHRRTTGLPTADVLHDKVVEVLKAARTFHITYQASIAYDYVPRLPLVRVPTLLACARDDMMIEYLDQVAELLPQAQVLLTGGVSGQQDLLRTSASFDEFLDAGEIWPRPA